MERKPTVKVILLCYFAHTIDDVLGDLLHYMPASSYVNNVCPTTLYQPTTQTIPLFVFNFLILGLFSNLAKQENSQLLLDVWMFTNKEKHLFAIFVFIIHHGNFVTIRFLDLLMVVFLDFHISLSLFSPIF